MATIKLTGLNASTGRQATAGDNDTVDLAGSLTIGNNVDDAVVFNAEIDSHFIPDDDNTYDLGSASKKWRYGYFEQINAKQRDVKLSKYTESGSNMRFIRFNSTGVAGNKNCGQNSIIVAPADGSLLSLTIRCEALARSTDITFHKAGDGFVLPSNETTGDSYRPMPVVETENVDIDTINKSFVVNFSSATFTAGEILAVSIDPTNAPDDVNITTVWLFDWNS